MAKRKITRSTSGLKVKDFSKWNFIIFLTLAFILLVLILNFASQTSHDIRSRAGLECPKLTAPRAEDCAGGWTFKRAADGCLAFFCEAKPTIAPIK